MSDKNPTVYQQAWDLNKEAPNATFTVDAIGVYYEGYLRPVESERLWACTVHDGLHPESSFNAAGCERESTAPRMWVVVVSDE